MRYTDIMKTKRKPKPRKRTESVRSILNRIDRFLLKGNAASRDLWNILSALRGPDEGYHRHSKRFTTVPVRRKAFPLLATAAMNSLHYIPADLSQKVFRPGNHSDHFSRHIRSAAMALGLTTGDKP